MSLRLLPAFVTDNDDDDDGNFTNWMSSYWGHGSEGRVARETKRSFRRPARSQTDRRASLPCVSQLDAMRLSRLHTGAIGASSSSSSSSAHAGRPGEENRNGLRPQPRPRRSSSDENSRAHAAVGESRITTIPELAESFEKRLSLGKKAAASRSETDGLCLICHEDLRGGGAGTLEGHCTHRFPREASRRLEHGRSRSSSSAAAERDAWRSAQDEQRRSSKEMDCLTPHRQFSLRRHR